MIEIQEIQSDAIGQIVDEAAKRYEQEGYKAVVFLDTTSSSGAPEIPPTLREFCPDVIAIRPDRSIFFEVRLPGRVRPANYWHNLSEAIQGLPDWHLELQNVSREPQFVEIAGKEEIQTLQAESRLLMEQGLNNAALLVAWAALEAAARHLQKQFAPEDANSNPAAPNQVVRQLYENGLLERTDYDFLLALARQRNAAAHGFHHTVSAEDLNRIIAIIETLLAE